MLSVANGQLVVVYISQDYRIFVVQSKFIQPDPNGPITVTFDAGTTEDWISSVLNGLPHP